MSKSYQFPIISFGICIAVDISLVASSKTLLERTDRLGVNICLHSHSDGLTLTVSEELQQSIILKTTWSSLRASYGTAFRDNECTLLRSPSRQC
jgi:hypothetical protein